MLDGFVSNLFISQGMAEQTNHIPPSLVPLPMDIPNHLGVLHLHQQELVSDQIVEQLDLPADEILESHKFLLEVDLSELH